ncbi:hypothetical protein TNIN_446321 [Trichonephila inaurata madagascariensis]|uniref:Uncharacterized protein n=1 Tax=Trichonephila inaurata madagascariensis TaxID=2747483 RepID=A0A8X6YX79_9ARAC|nr:hypothetical protein TNIN_446321 [Trichonephila inaurata madagascariensis]
MKLEDRIREDTKQGKLKTNPDGSTNIKRDSVRGASVNARASIAVKHSPVAKSGTIGTVLSIIAQERMHLTQFDTSTALLNGDLKKTIYIQQPEEVSKMAQEEY